MSRVAAVFLRLICLEFRRSARAGPYVFEGVWRPPCRVLRLNSALGPTPRSAAEQMAVTEGKTL
jgi:hypothetical protein